MIPINEENDTFLKQFTGLNIPSKGLILEIKIAGGNLFIMVQSPDTNHTVCCSGLQSKIKIARGNLSTTTLTHGSKAQNRSCDKFRYTMILALELIYKQKIIIIKCQLIRYQQNVMRIDSI